MARSRRTLLSVLVAVLGASVLAVAGVALAGPTSHAAAAKPKAAAPVSLRFHFANLPAKAGGIVVFTAGVQAIPTQAALSTAPGTIRFFLAHQRGFTIQAADNAPLDADISFTPEPTAYATAYTGHATVPPGATLTVQVGAGGASAQIPDGDFTIPLTTLGKPKPH